MVRGSEMVNGESGVNPINQLPCLLIGLAELINTQPVSGTSGQPHRTLSQRKNRVRQIHPCQEAQRPGSIPRCPMREITDAQIHKNDWCIGIAALMAPAPQRNN